MLGSEEGQGLINSKATPFDLALLGRCCMQMQGVPLVSSQAAAQQAAGSDRYDPSLYL
jgi:hypothetical protein